MLEFGSWTGSLGTFFRHCVVCIRGRTLRGHTQQVEVLTSDFVESKDMIFFLVQGDLLLKSRQALQKRKVLVEEKLQFLFGSSDDF